MTRAAKFLAETFNGQLVDADLDDPQNSAQQDPSSTPPKTTIANEGSNSEQSKPDSVPEPELDSDDDDIPF